MGDIDGSSSNENYDTLKFLDMYNTIYAMRQDLERTKKPVGTRESPARSCKDLFYGHSSFNDGILSY